MDDGFCLEFKVRDHECDLQGVVNNAVYLHYLEHARHEFLLSRGIDFAALAKAGIHPVVVRAELDYKRSLRPGDTFHVRVRCRMEGRIRIVFLQDIVHANGGIALAARVVATVVDSRGRPRIPEGLAAIIVANSTVA